MWCNCKNNFHSQPNKNQAELCVFIFNFFAMCFFTACMGTSAKQTRTKMFNYAVISQITFHNPLHTEKFFLESFLEIFKKKITKM